MRATTARTFGLVGAAGFAGPAGAGLVGFAAPGAAWVVAWPEGDVGLAVLGAGAGAADAAGAFGALGTCGSCCARTDGAVRLANAAARTTTMTARRLVISGARR